MPFRVCNAAFIVYKLMTIYSSCTITTFPGILSTVVNQHSFIHDIVPLSMLGMLCKQTDLLDSQAHDFVRELLALRMLRRAVFSQFD